MSTSTIAATIQHEPELLGQTVVVIGDPASRAHRPRRDFVQFDKRLGERTSACGGCPRQTREAHWAARRELAGVVRRVHRARAVRQRTASMNGY